MAICKFCDRDMHSGQSCLVTADRETRALRLAYGEETYYAQHRDVQLPERCHDCGVTKGGLHHPGYDMEECPRCEGQLISCDCPTTMTTFEPHPTASGLRVLPVYSGWTIDLRCRQFRKVHEDGWIDFVDFDSGEGDRLLSHFITQGVNLEPVVIA